MSAQHTPGRMQSSHQFFSEGAPLFIASEAGQIVARIENRVSGRPLTQEDAENARRLVACWNACDGLRTESLERMGTLDRATIAHEVAAQSRIKLLEEQRDELLSAIGACRDAMQESAVRVNDAIADPLSVPDYVRESVSLLVAQREELLATVKTITKSAGDMKFDAYAFARAAIAKAGGKA